MAAPTPNKKYKTERAVGGHVVKNGYDGAPGDTRWLSAALGQPNGSPHDYNKVSTAGNGKAAIDNALENPTMVVKKYYVNNWEMLQSQTELMTHVYETGDSIMAKGVYFITDDGIICEPTDDFKSFCDNYLYTAMRRGFIWFMCFGYAVWFKTYRHGREVVFVPDPCQVIVDHLYDKKTQAPLVTLEWKEEDVDSQLYYFAGNPFATTREFQCSPMDAVGPLIDQLEQMKQARILMMNNIARPQAAVQENIRRTVGTDINADAPNELNTASRLMLQHAEIEGGDDQMLNRVNQMRRRNAEAVSELADTVGVESIPPYMRTQRALEEPISNRFVSILPGMQAVNINTPVHDLDYNTNYQFIIAMLDRIMGVKPAAPPTGTGDSKTQPPGGGGKPDGDIAYKWRQLLGDFATSIVRTLYNPDSFRLFDPRQTWDEEKKLNDERKKMDIGDLFKDDIKDAQDGIKTNKRTRLEDDDDDSEAVSLGDMIKRDKMGVRVVLVSHMLSDRDMASKLMQQGGMSKDNYETMYPKPPQPEKQKTIKAKKK